MSESIGDFLDSQFAAQDAAGASAETAPVAPPAEAAAPPAQSEAPVDLDAALEGDKFDRAYVERLRKEAAGYRTRANELESVFDGYNDDERAGLAQLAQMLKSDPRAAAQEMKAAYDAIMAQYQEPETPEFSDADRILTMGEYQKLQEQAAIDAETRAIEAEAKSLGYTPRADNVEYRQLLLVAQHQAGGDIAAAHKLITDRAAAAEQAAIDRYLAAKAADAQGYTPPGEMGQVPSTAEPIRDWKQARSALENYIAQQKR